MLKSEHYGIHQIKVQNIICSRAVSYTHLDVYKRQLRHGWKLFWQVKTDVMIKGEDLFRTGIVLGVKPVSYTHLDVYKRQGEHGG